MGLFNRNLNFAANTAKTQLAAHTAPFACPHSCVNESTCALTIAYAAGIFAAEMRRTALLFSLLACLFEVEITPASILYDSSYGYRLPSPPEVAVWWCEATWKVGRERALPQATNTAVQIEAARNEYEPFQLVLRPQVTLSNVTVSAGNLVRQGGPPNATISATNIQVCLVEYVPVAEASDEFGAPGWYPDPLFPLSGPVTLAAQTNQPFWITVYVPKDTPAGLYTGTITVNVGWAIPVPIRLRVYDFTLPDVTHTRSAFYVSLETQWHGPLTTQQKNQLWDIYMENFRAHRVAPYSPHFYAPIKWSYADGDFAVDFVEFESAMKKYLGEFAFNAYNLMGHKSPLFPFTLGDYPAFSPEYGLLLQKLMNKICARLRENGWFDAAYCYWLDEPNYTNLEFCIAGMNTILASAPGLKRLVTIASFPPFEELLPNVDIAVPLMHRTYYDGYQQKQHLGDELWGYLACYPKHPAPNLFIDHPAVNHRIVFWYAENRSISGLLYWGVNYWPTNVWQMPKAREDVPNGDGLLWYPPVRSLPTNPVVTPPINSLRWELIREGLEDREYFWLLRQAITNALVRIGPESEAVHSGIAALNSGLAIAVSLTNLAGYSRDPIALYSRRRSIADAIELLDTGVPFFVRHPNSSAVHFGEVVKLYSEALGWPMPNYQWQLNGNDLPGKTNATLTITNVRAEDLGDYTVVAWNEYGRATSSVARVRGRWLGPPQIVTDPANIVKREQGYAVLAVSAVSTSPCSYQWFKDGTPLTSPYATNDVLLITNLDSSHSGLYHVLVSNQFGAVLSSPARLIVLRETRRYTVFPTNSPWRYHDLGYAIGPQWIETDYDDSAWAGGSAPLGFGTGQEVTQIGGSGPDKPTTVYFRRTFEVPPLQPQSILKASLRCVGGAIVYLNGSEIFRYNMPSGTVYFDTPALSAEQGTNGFPQAEFEVPRALLTGNTNVFAIEVHQSPHPAFPVAFWTLDEAEPPWNDQMGGHDFVRVGTNLVTLPGRVGGCVSNPASPSSWLETPDRPELRYTGPFTVGGWFAFGQQYGNDPATTCLGKDGEFRLYYTGTVTNRYRFRVGQTEVQDQTAGTISGQWRFVVAWYDGTNACIQVDNGPVYRTPVAPPEPTTNPLVALRRAGMSGGFAADEVFFFKRVLTQQERSYLYLTGLRAWLTSNVEKLLFDLSLEVLDGQPPIFTNPPGSMVRLNGESAAFRLVAISSTPVSYQWLLNGAPIVGATNSLLFLPAVSTAQAGWYSLVASNIGGAVTSAPARLIVVSPPRLDARLHANGRLVLDLPGCEVTSAVLTSTNLVDWMPVLVREAGSGPTNLVMEVDPNEPQRYYRLRLDW